MHYCLYRYQILKKMKKTVDFLGKKWYYNFRAADIAAKQLEKKEKTRKKLKNLLTN